MNPIVEGMAVKIAEAENATDLKILANRIRQDLKAGKWYAKDDESIRYLRKVWKARSFVIESRLKCAPHNRAENFVVKGGKVWCKVCGKYIGREFNIPDRKEKESYE